VGIGGRRTARGTPCSAPGDTASPAAARAVNGDAMMREAFQPERLSSFSRMTNRCYAELDATLHIRPQSNRYRRSNFMKRLFAIFLFALLVLPIVVSAQNSKVLWDLSDENYIDVTDLGFRFYYPTGWVYDTSNGIAFAENQADLDAQIDDDDSTIPSGVTITVRGIALSDLTDLGKNPKLDAVADFTVDAAGVKEDERVEVPIMARRSILIIGENNTGRYGIGTLWMQNGYLVLVSLGGADQPTIQNLAYTWGVTLGHITPLDTEPLGEGQLASDVSQFTMNYPEGWVPDPKQSSIAYENEEDIGQALSDISGINLSVIDSPLADLSIPADTPVDDLSAAMNTSFGLDKNTVSEEFIFLGQPARLSSGEIDDGNGGKKGLIITAAIIEDRAVIFVVLAPSGERVTGFMPTWVRMLQSVQSTAKSP
jgi:hypothetical protein